MATGTALSELLLMLKAELGADLDQNVAPGGDDILMRQLSTQQKWLAMHHDFADMNFREEFNVVAGTRYYDFPTSGGLALDTSKRVTVESYWSNLWYTVEPGIKLVNYNTLNPDLGMRLDPVIRWQKYRPDASKVQMELWPLPASATKLRVSGQLVLPTLVATTDTCYLDDVLIVQWTAAKLLARYKSSDAQAMLAEAQKSLARLISGDNTPSEVFSMGGSRGAQRRRDYDRPTVAVNYTP